MKNHANMIRIIFVFASAFVAIASNAQAFSIGTQNLMHYPKRYAERAAVLKSEITQGRVPDIMGFQEAAYWGPLSLYGAFVTMSGYQGLYQDTNNYLLVNDGIALQTHLPTRDLQAKALPATLPLSNQYLISGTVETDAGAVGVVVAHFSPKGRGQKIQAQFVIEHVKNVFGDQPTIIVGDLNDKPDSDTLQVFRDAGYSDSLNWQELTFVPHVNPYNSDRTAMRLDYILYRADQLRLMTSSLMFQADPISDHYGIRADFSRL